VLVDFDGDRSLSGTSDLAIDVTGSTGGFAASDFI
jgi:hypothetical protein